MKEHQLNDILLPDYSLRCHKSGVTASLFVEWPSKSRVPILITGDSSGLLVLWDLIIRRPMITYGLEDGAQVVALQDLGDKRIAVLSKNHKLRLFEMVSEETKALAKSSTVNGDSLQRFHQIYEIPVNTLNFANFLVQKLRQDYYRLICINTQNSETIDIYHFHISDLHSLTRAFKGLTFSGIIQQLVTDPDSAKAKKMGIVMKFLEHDGIIYCGFESGLVVAFKIFEQGVEGICSSGDGGTGSHYFIQIVYVSSVHYPDPVLDLALNGESEEILSSSTKNLIGVHPKILVEDVINSDQPDYLHDRDQLVLMRKDLEISSSNFRHIPMSGVGHLAVVNGELVLGTWSGITCILGPDFRERARMSKSRSNVLVSDSSQGSLQGATDDKSQKRHSKVSSLTGISSTDIQQFIAADRQLILRPGQSRRIKQFSEKSWCVIGYDDGSIAVHQTQPSRKDVIQ